MVLSSNVASTVMWMGILAGLRAVFDLMESSLERIAVQRAIARLVANKTVVAIAHRLSTVVGADRILVLEAGSRQLTIY